MKNAQAKQKKDCSVKNTPILSELPEDFSMLGSCLRQDAHLSSQLEAEYETILTRKTRSENDLKISLYHLDQLMNQHMNFEKASQVTAFIEKHFSKYLDKKSYFTAIFYMNKASLYSKHFKMYENAVELALKAAEYLDQTPYKAEIFRVDTLLAQIYFEADARYEALHALGQAQRIVQHISSPDYLTSYYFIAARLNFEAQHYKDSLHYLDLAKESSVNTAFQTTHVTILFDCLKVEALIELGERAKAETVFKSIMTLYERLYVNETNIFMARIFTVQAKLLIMKYEIFSANDVAKKAVDLFEEHDLSKDTLYYIKALEIACDAYSVVGLAEEAKEVCLKMITQLNDFVLYPGESIRVQRAKDILESLTL